MATRKPPARRDAATTADGAPTVIGVGFLLAQLGSHSAAEYAKRIVPLGLTPPEVGVLRAIGEEPGRSQQAIADQFGLPPSRMVGFIDDLERLELVERRRDAADRRVHLLHLSDKGTKMLKELALVGRDASRELLVGLSDEESDQLFALLTRVADQQGLQRGIHPGYQGLARRQEPGGSIQCGPTAE